MYSSSNHYKDACEIGQIEYASLYRTLLWLVKAKQKGIKLGEVLEQKGYTDIVLIGAGDICDIFCREIEGTNVSIDGIIDDNLKKFLPKYGKAMLRSYDQVNAEFLENKLLVVMRVDRFDNWVMRLQKKGANIDRIISVEELVAYLLLV